MMPGKKRRAEQLTGVGSGRARRRLRGLLGIAAVLLATISPAVLPRAVAAIEELDWLGTFHVEFSDDCWSRSLEASGTASAHVVRRDDGSMAISGAFGGSEHVSRHVLCGEAHTTYDVDAEVTYGGSWNATVDPVTGAFVAGIDPDVAALATNTVGRIANCLDSSGSPCNRSDNESEFFLFGIIVRGTISLSGSVSGSMDDADPKTDVHGSWQASGAPFRGAQPTESPGCPATGAAGARGLLAMAGPALHRTGQSPDCGMVIDVAVDHIEVVQVVQDPANTVPLVAQKATVARVFLRVNGAHPVPSVPVTVELFGLRGGSTVQPTLNRINRLVTVRPTPDRNSGEESVAFRLPPTWTAPGSLRLEATVSERDPWVELMPDDNDDVETVEFSDRPALNVAYVPLCIGDLPADCPTPLLQAGVNAEANVPPSVYPVPDEGFHLFALPTPGAWTFSRGLHSPSDAGPLLVWLRSQFDLARAQSAARDLYPDELVGFVPAAAGAVVHAAGAADSPQWGGARTLNVGRVVYLGDADIGWGLAHEIGHNLGLNHLQPGPDESECGEPAAPFDPGGTAIDEVGYDVANMAVVPATTKDMMSSCPQPHWISTAHYRALLATGLQPPTGEARPNPTNKLGGALTVGHGRAFEARPAQASKATRPAQELIVTGTIRKDGTGGTLDPAFSIPADPTTPREPSTAGPVCLRLLGSAGVDVDRCFDVSFVAPESGEQVDQAAFSIHLADPPGANSLSLTFNGRLLATILAGARPPTLSVDSRALETWTRPQALSWTATTSTGGRPRATILYSPDGGRSWLPFAPDPARDVVSIDPRALVAGSTNFFRVLVTDGLQTSAADIGPITVPESVGRPALPTGNSAPEPGASAPASSGAAGLPAAAHPTGDAGSRFLPIAILLLLAGAGIGGLRFLIRRPGFRGKA